MKRVVLIALLACRPLVAYDFGAAVDSATTALGSQEAELFHKDRLTVWYEAGLGPEADLTARASYTYSLEDPLLLDLEALTLRAALLPQLRYSLGRVEVSDFTGQVLDHRIDGLLLTHQLPAVSIRGFLGYTGLVPGHSSTIQLSLADGADLGGSWLGLGSPRLVGGVGLEIPDALGRQTAFLDVLFQKDLHKGAEIITAGEEQEVPAGAGLGGRLDTQYLGLGLAGPLGWAWFYDVYAFAGSGTTLSYVEDPDSITGRAWHYRPILALLAGGGVRMYLEEALFSRLWLRALFSSGDADHSRFLEGNRDEVSTAFVPISRPEYGLVFSPQPGNLVLLEAGYSLKPFARGGSQALGRTVVSLSGYGFFRPTDAPVSDADLDPASDALYLGSEVDVVVSLRLASDLGLVISGGAFLPSGGGVFLDAPELEYLARAELSFSF